MVTRYFERFGYAPRQIDEMPDRNLSMVVVIPCYDEPDLIGSLESLRQCAPASDAVEVIVVVNSSEASSTEARRRNAETVVKAREWQHAGTGSPFRLHILDFPDLPRRQAGVGLARKIGMDEALRRFDAVGGLDRGVILCFDADCQCDSNLLVNVEAHFNRHPSTPGCSLYFEHPLSGALDRRIHEAAAAYELHLRYYVEALRFAHFPHAFHTVGSSMAVRAAVYAAQGGMNKRQAAEDFYFLHKIIPLGGFTDLASVRVIPSPRASHRVPFGTGRTVGRLLETGERMSTYPLEAFDELRGLFTRVQQFRLGTDPEPNVDGTLRTFLHAQRFGEALDEIRRNSANAVTFEKRFFRWFDGFRVMKFIHHARDTCYGCRDVVTEASTLLGRLGQGGAAGEGVAACLQIYRARARAHGGLDGGGM